MKNKKIKINGPAYFVMNDTKPFPFCVETICYTRKEAFAVAQKLNRDWHRGGDEPIFFVMKYDFDIRKFEYIDFDL